MQSYTSTGKAKQVYDINKQEETKRHWNIEKEGDCLTVWEMMKQIMSEVTKIRSERKS